MGCDFLFFGENIFIITLLRTSIHVSMTVTIAPYLSHGVTMVNGAWLMRDVSGAVVLIVGSALSSA